MRTYWNHFFEIFLTFQRTGGIPLRQGLKYVDFELDRQCWNVKNTTSEGNQRVLVSQRALPYKSKTRFRHTTKFYVNQHQIKRIRFFFIFVLVFHNFNVHKPCKNKRGPKIEPCGTPLSGLARQESSPKTQCDTEANTSLQLSKWGSRQVKRYQENLQWSTSWLDS